MAVIWDKVSKGVHYEVRQAGNSRRLYTDGIFHSQWNPSRPFSGHIWDLLFLPVLLHPRSVSLSKALMLGVGGGSLINLLDYFAADVAIDGVDLDAHHLAIAKRFFLPRHASARLIHEDAVKFVASLKCDTYDLIVDDLFLAKEKSQTDDPAEPVRPVKVDDAWLLGIKKGLSSGGVAVFNFENSEQLRQSLTKKRISACGFCGVFEFKNKRYENSIAAVVSAPVTRADFDKALDALLIQYPRSEVRDLSFYFEQVV